LLAGTLITYAYYLSGVVSRNLEDVDETQVHDGVLLLNNVLSEINVTGRYIPYFSYSEISAVQGQEVYFIPNIVDLMTATFNIGTVRYPMNRDQLRHYYGAPRVDNIQALPYNWFWERVVGGVNVSVYFTPSSSSWVFKFKGKTGLPSVGEETELNTAYDSYYQLFLQYKLADYICDWYSLTLPPNVEAKLKSFENIYANINADDYSINKTATAAKSQSLSYAQANIGKGWTAP
jgi:hypothetical protein